MDHSKHAISTHHRYPGLEPDAPRILAGGPRLIERADFDRPVQS
jgi:hypothetical protein